MSEPERYARTEKGIMRVNRFNAHQTMQSGITRTDATLYDFAFPLHSHDHFVIATRNSIAIAKNRLAYG